MLYFVLALPLIYLVVLLGYNTTTLCYPLFKNERENR